MSHPDKLTDLTSPKRQRTTRSGATKSRGLSYLSNQPSSEHAHPEPYFEPPTTTILHKCPITTDPELKHVEENLASSDAETPTLEIPPHSTSGETPVVEFLAPSSKNQTPATLFATVVFQQKLFGLDLGSFMHQKSIQRL